MTTTLLICIVFFILILILAPEAFFSLLATIFEGVVELFKFVFPVLLKAVIWTVEQAIELSKWCINGVVSLFTKAIQNSSTPSSVYGRLGNVLDGVMGVMDTLGGKVDSMGAAFSRRIDKKETPPTESKMSQFHINQQIYSKKLSDFLKDNPNTEILINRPQTEIHIPTTKHEDNHKKQKAELTEERGKILLRLAEKQGEQEEDNIVKELDEIEIKLNKLGENY